MLDNRQRKYAQTDKDWQIQREIYVTRSRSLSHEFENYKRQRQSPTRVVTLEGNPNGGIGSQLMRIPQGYRQMQLLKGCAWVSYRGEDYLMRSGEQMTFDGDSQNATISPLGYDALSFQLSIS
jgi:hypothetical protein